MHVIRVKPYGFLAPSVVVARIELVELVVTNPAYTAARLARPVCSPSDVLTEQAVNWSRFDVHTNSLPEYLHQLLHFVQFAGVQVVILDSMSELVTGIDSGLLNLVPPCPAAQCHNVAIQRR